MSVFEGRTKGYTNLSQTVMNKENNWFDYGYSGLYIPTYDYMHQHTV